MTADRAHRGKITATQLARARFCSSLHQPVSSGTSTVPPPPPMRPPLSVPDIDAQPPATIIAAAHVTHSKEIRLIEYSIF